MKCLKGSTLAFCSVMVIFFNLLIVGNCNAFMANWSKPISVGADFDQGDDVLVGDRWQNNECHTQMYGISVRTEFQNLTYENLRFQVEANWFQHKANENPRNGKDSGHDRSHKEYGLNGMIKYHPFNGKFYTGLLLGLGYRGQSSPEWTLGDSTLLGTAGFAVGTDIPVHGNWYLRAGGEVVHTSAPLVPDHGMNYFKGTVGVTYYFPINPL